MAYQGNVKKNISERPWPTARNTFKPTVVEGPGTQAAPAGFSKSAYEGMTGGKAPVARPSPYFKSEHTRPDAENRVHFQSGPHPVAHNETEKESAKPQERISEYHQKFDIASGTRSD